MTIVFAGSPLDRACNRRRDSRWLEQQMSAPESRYLAMWRLQAMLRVGDPPGIAWATAEIRASGDARTGAVFLGLRGEEAPPSHVRPHLQRSGIAGLGHDHADSGLGRSDLGPEQVGELLDYRPGILVHPL